ncbi:MAG: LamG domain-containing protein [Pirellulaceae bacterium]|nr:LamG domain-containing protein [Pirellulaceae bacterium]
MPARKLFCLAARAFLALNCVAIQAAEEPFAWQQDYARVTEKGDIEWTPRPFHFVAGGSLRFIDYESGSDAADGASPQRPWKHHPWDAAATDSAAAAKGIETYVFKGGVVYRGQLTVKEQGRPGSPIRLTRDPSWGVGPAILAGSQVVTGWSKGATHPKIPEPAAVWQATLDFAPRTLWMVDAHGAATRLPLARHPNWTSQPEDHKAQWFTWTNNPHPFRAKEGFSANDAAHLQGLDRDFVHEALIYSEFGWVMGTPYPTRVLNFDPADGSVRFANWTGGGNASVIFRGMRYYLEDKPQYLDDPAGEFWFDKRGAGGTLYARLPGGIDPQTVRIEAGRHSDLVLGSDVQHLEISGLDFRWTTQPWELDVASWDFRTKPFGVRPEAHPACIRIWGRGEAIRISNCRFQDVVMGVGMRAIGEGSPIRDITVEDNVFQHTDAGAASFTAGAGWGFSHPVGVLDDVRLYRNYATDIGFRAPRYERGCTFDLTHPFRAHIAGNVVERCGAQAINVVAGKGATRGDVPLVRVLIQQNKAWKTMQNGNDFGGIESWQHGPVYIFNNLSFDARGQREGERIHNRGNPGFGHAYYLDGGFKHYVFNNLAWGLANDPTSPLVNCSAFQEIYSHQNLFVNNTAYNFTVGSRRQAPHAGRNKYVGNVWQGLSERVFRHADPAKTQADGNAAHAGPQKDHFAYETNAYAGNVFYDIAQLGVFETSGRWLQTLDDFRAALQKQGSLVAELGVMDRVAPLRGPARGDFRLNPASAAVDQGAVAFVPWALHGVVAEWNFYPAGNDPAQIIDEHWYAKDYLTDRTEYHARPTYPLTTVNVDPQDYIDGPLENFAPGALRLDPAKKAYATIHNADLSKPFTTKLTTRAAHGQDPQPQEFTFAGDDLKNPAIHASNFLIEVYFRADGDGLIIGKQQRTGYSLQLRDGRAVFRVAAAGGVSAELTSQARMSDGRWHHVLAESDRESRVLSIYVDGKLDGTGRGIGKVSLANDGDLNVGGSSEGDHLSGAIDFLRIAHGTLAEAHTSIEELYAWQFDGPARRDMRGASPQGKGRDAGAIETF